MAKFQIEPVNKREGEYHAPGSVELVRQHAPGSSAQVWILSPSDMKQLAKALLEELLDG